MAASQRRGGFDCDFVTPPKVIQSECPICLLILREPYLTSCCGNSFCQVCIERIKTGNKPCPTCKERNFSTFPNKGLQRSLYEFQVYCSHKQEGCEWKGELGQLDKHLVHYCVSTAIDCDFHHVGCDVRLPRNDMLTHLKENLVTHMSLQAASYSKLLASHNDLQATYNELLVNYSDLQDEVRSLKLEKANDSKLLATVQDKVQKLENESGIVQQFSLPTPGHVEFILENYEQYRRKNIEYYFPPFYTHSRGYKLCLRIVPNGLSDSKVSAKGTHVSVFVHLMRGEFDDSLKWPFRGRITVQIVDQEDKSANLQLAMIFTERTPDSAAGKVTHGERQHTGIGSHQFIPQNKLKPKYLKNDCLCFRVTKITY